MSWDAIPTELRERNQWLVWSEESEPAKAPLTVEGYHASWNDPGEWVSYEQAKRAVQENDELTGVGFVVAGNDPFIGLDLDGCLREPFEEQPEDWLPSLDWVQKTWAEYSGSGYGIHVFVEDGSLPTWWQNAHFEEGSHEGVEAYEEKFFALTGNQVEFSNDTITSPEIGNFLRKAYTNIVGEEPTLPGEREPENTSGELNIDCYDVLSRAAYPEEENTSHPFHGSETGTNFRVDEHGESWRCWRHEVTGGPAHLLGMKFGIIDCGEWEGGTISGDTWREIFDTARENGYDIPKPTLANGGVTAQTGEADRTGEQNVETSITWADVRALYDSEESGSTTKANNIAADLIDGEYDILPIRDTGVVYFYDDAKGYYVRKGERFLEQVIQSKLREQWNVNRARNVSKNIIARNWVSVNEFTPPKGKVNVKNGVLDLETRELESHSPEFYFTAQLNVEYDPDAECDMWPEFLEDITTQPGEANKIEEFIGYSLQVWKHDRHKNLFIVGPTQSGKSTLSEVVAGLFGDPPTVINLTPQQIADTRFDAASLQDAMLNTVNDINASKIENSGALKRVFAGEPLKLESKHKDASFGAPKTKHLFTANWLPPIVGEDEAVWRRILIVEFPDSVSRSERIKGLGKQLQDELSGILNRALDALDRLKDNDGFTNDRTRDDTRKIWDSWRDAHKRFLYTQFNVSGNTDDAVEKDTYYQAYKEYAAQEGFEIKPKQSVTKSLKWVPEIAVQDDAYSGIDWNETKTPETSEADQARLSQSSLTQNILNWVDEFSNPINGAQRQDLLEYADSMDYEQERVEHTVDRLLTEGRLVKSGDGIRIT